MRFRSIVKGSLTQFWMNPVRTMLTLLGIVFGVSSVIAMMTIGEGAQNKILENIKAMGANLVHISSNKVGKGQISKIINNSRGLSQKDVQVLKNVIPLDRRDVAALSKVPVKTSSLDLPSTDIHVYAVSQNFSKVAGLEIPRGRDFASHDFSSLAPVIMISLQNANKLFGSAEKAVGEWVSFDYMFFRIIGVYDLPGLSIYGNKKKKSRNLPFNPGEFIFSFLLPISTFHEKIIAPQVYDDLDRILIRCQDLMETSQIKVLAEKVLAITHNGEIDYKILAPQELLEQKQATQRIFNIVLLSIASISLLVGGIGIMNIMLSNVLERKSEIGIRRALGAKKRNIVFQFLFESIFICVIGGTAGIFLGLGISLGILHFTDIPIAFSITPVFLSFLISLIVGLVFGILPAWEAANLNPVEALHHE